MASVSDTQPRDVGSWKSLCASRLAAKKITEEYNYFRDLKDTNPPALPKPNDEIGKVCIIGAGMSDKLCPQKLQD